jgi:pilus assembly protein CpaF
MTEPNATSTSSSPFNERSGRVVRTVGDSVQQQIKTSVHKELIKRVDLDKLAGMQETLAAQQQLFLVIQQIIGEQGVPLSASERDHLAQEVVDEVFGLGPLEPLLKDDGINDILVNTYNSI